MSLDVYLHTERCKSCGRHDVVFEANITHNLNKMAEEDRKMDAAGSMDNVHYSADLCDGCLREFSYWLAKKINERFPGTLLKAFMETKHARRT